MNEVVDITEKLKSFAEKTGFDKIGISPVYKIDGKFLETWIRKGYNASMAWMQRTMEKRIDPDKYLPGVRSVISTAVSYYSPDEDRPSNSLQISRYASGLDYHDVIKNMLSDLDQLIKELIPGVKTKIAVDDAPVLDKIWAANSGIGWIGKNSNLITKEMGSYVFLGEILTDCELQYGSPVKDYCGTCTACIDACPTEAILGNKIVDSSRCISYRTIEFRGDFPGEWGNENRDWIFGCDICQEVCPWNKFSKTTKIDDFKPQEQNRFPNMDYFEKVSAEEFRERYKNSPVKRAKWEGLNRNIKAAKQYIEVIS
ncbi:tRNA epoxyqueuosine(34) reductase QueG [candidate division KSB1 bacterium]